MISALNQFKGNIQYVKNLNAIYTGLTNQVTSAIDLSDILRAELVFGVSALDSFIHELVRIGMVEIFKNNRSTTNSFNNFMVSMEHLTTIINNSSPTEREALFSQEIRNRLSWRSFQRSSKISEAIKLMSDVGLWDEVGNYLSTPPEDVKNRLDIIVERRDKIAHEADIDPTYNTKWPINEVMVNDSIVFLENLAEAIYKSI